MKICIDKIIAYDDFDDELAVIERFDDVSWSLKIDKIISPDELDEIANAFRWLNKSDDFKYYEVEG